MIESLKMAGQVAEAAPASSLDDVAGFLFDNEGADSALEDRDNPQQATEPDEDHSDLETIEAEEGDEQADPDADTDEGDEPAEGDEGTQSDKSKFEVRVVGADGAEVAEKVTLEELKASYLRHSDYTRKTMELGERERQATELVSTKLNEGRNTYLQEAAKAHQAIVMLAGIKPDNEMAMLAQTDPGQYVAEKARVEAIQGVLHQIETGMRQHAQTAERETLEAQKAAYHAAWGELGKQGIDRQKLISIFTQVHNTYGVPKERFANIIDPKLVAIMADAVAYRALKKDTAKIKPVVAKAPSLPQQRQPVPQQARASKQLNAKFKSGKANTRDLAAFLMSNGG